MQCVIPSAGHAHVRVQVAWSVALLKVPATHAAKAHINANTHKHAIVPSFYEHARAGNSFRVRLQASTPTWAGAALAVPVGQPKYERGMCSSQYVAEDAHAPDDPRTRTQAAGLAKVGLVGARRTR
jgi:hypothetical protein